MFVIYFFGRLFLLKAVLSLRSENLGAVLTCVTRADKLRLVERFTAEPEELGRHLLFTSCPIHGSTRMVTRGATDFVASCWGSFCVFSQPFLHQVSGWNDLRTGHDVTHCNWVLFLSEHSLLDTTLERIIGRFAKGGGLTWSLKTLPKRAG